MTIQELNNLSTTEAFDAFEKCCASTTWVNKMVAARPFNSPEELYNKSEDFWWQSDKKDWLEACEGHPKIGDVSSLKKKYAETKAWAGNEQSGMNTASDAIIENLAKGNSDYENKFGYIFIVCATGKSAAEMSEILEKRLPNDEVTELKIAMGEQNKITKIRLEKLLTS